MVVDWNLKRVECDPECGFMIQSHDEEEVVEATQKHAEKAHNMKTSKEDIRAMMQAI